eukprot:5831704-Pyramimonas_sp.AAC.1
MLEVEASSEEEEFNPDKAMEQIFRNSKKTQKDIKQRFKDDVQVVSARQDAMDKTVAELSRQVAELQQAKTNSSSESVISSQSGNAYGGGTRASREQWNPTYVQLSGW